MSLTDAPRETVNDEVERGRARRDGRSEARTDPGTDPGPPRISGRLGRGRLVNVRDDGQPPTVYARRAVSRKPAVRAAVLGLVLVLLLQFVVTRYTIEHSIENRAFAAVRRAGFLAVTVDAHGRDVTLSGRTATLAEAYQATRIAGDQEGVHTVDSSIVVDPTIITAALAKAKAAAEAAAKANGFQLPASTPTPTGLPATPTVTATIEARRITLAGVVGDEATRDRVKAAAAAVFGTGAVTDRMLVAQSAGTTGAVGLVAALSALDPAATGTYRLQLGYLTLSGTVPTTAVHDEVLARSRAALKDPAKVTDSLVVVTGGADQELVLRLSALPSPAFAGAGATLTAAGRNTVADIATALRAQPGSSIRIEGHVDTTGSARTDRGRSTERADAVKAALVSAGIPAERLRTEGLGDTQPLVPDTTDVDRVINTRIDLTVVS